MPRTLRTADLRNACDRLISAAEARFGPEVDLDSVADYWSVDPRTAYTMADSPKLVAGSISDDLDELHDLLERPVEETHLWHDLDHLTGLLRAIAFLDLPPAAK